MARHIRGIGVVGRDVGPSASSAQSAAILLEHKAQLRLELTVQRGLRVSASDQTEVGIGVVDTRNEICSCRARLRMIKYVQRVQSELNALGLANPHGFAHIRVKTPLSRSFQSSQTRIASPSGKRILKQNLAGAGIRDRIERA